MVIVRHAGEDVVLRGPIVHMKMFGAGEGGMVQLKRLSVDSLLSGLRED